MPGVGKTVLAECTLDIGWLTVFPTGSCSWICMQSVDGHHPARFRRRSHRPAIPSNSLVRPVNAAVSTGNVHLADPGGSGGRCTVY